jgi:hypothetical protein
VFRLRDFCGISWFTGRVRSLGGVPVTRALAEVANTEGMSWGCQISRNDLTA